MRHARRVYGLAGLAVVAVAAVAFAQTTVTPLPDAAPIEAAPLDTSSAVTDLAKAKWGDAKKGAALAGTCAACHGLDGNSTADPTIYPRIAGQSERYTAHQLALFKADERNTGMAAIMKPFAKMLSPQDMRDLGAYYATQKGGAGIADDTLIATGPNAGMRFYEVGERLFRSGDASRGIPACMACHGPSGAGNPGPAYPYIAGQQAWYSARRLQEYRAGTTDARDPVLFNVMATVAKPLTDEEIDSLGSYLQGLHDRADEAPADMVAMMAANPPTTTAPAAAPSTAAPAAEGTVPADGAAPTEGAAPADGTAPATPAGSEPQPGSTPPAPAGGAQPTPGTERSA